MTGRGKGVDRKDCREKKIRVDRKDGREDIGIRQERWQGGDRT
jgi:hypothetical protein